MDKTKVYIDLSGECSHCFGTGKNPGTGRIRCSCDKYYYEGIDSADPDGRLPCGHHINQATIIPKSKCSYCQGTGYVPVKMTLFDLLGMVADEMNKEGDA